MRSERARRSGLHGGFLLLLAFAAAWPAEAKLLRVPEDFATIQAAIDASVVDDTVQVGPGTYEEPLHFKSGIELLGAGPDVTIVSPSILKGEVLTIEDVESGFISGCAFRHPDTERYNPKQKEWPAAVRIKNSRVTVKQCSAGPSLGSGVSVSGTSVVEVTGCVAESNFQCGISVMGGEASATLRDNTCRRNKGYGIRLFKGARGQAERNRCAGNELSGIYLAGAHTEAVLLENECVKNTLTGFFAEDCAQYTARKNRCTENGWYGIHLARGVTGTLEENLCEGNSWHGIFVETISTRADLTGNECNRNGNNGIEFWLGAEGTVRGNHSNGNGGTGIAVNDWYTAVEFENNECIGNAYYGIHATGGCHLTASKNALRENKKSGLFVSDPGTEVESTDNVIAGNGEPDVSKSDGMPEFGQYRMPEQDVGWMMSAGRYEQLESLAERLRRLKCRTPEGRAPLRSFYNGVVHGYGALEHRDREVYLAAMQQWMEAFPKSPTPKIALGLAYIDYAWDQRGGGSADEVSREGAEGFAADLKKALTCFGEAAALEANDPQLYVGLITAGMGSSQSNETLNGYFEKGIAIDLTYPGLYQAMTNNLLPRWQGGKGEVEQFAERAAELTQKDLGEGMYAFVAMNTLASYSAVDFLSTHRFAWSRIKQGMENLTKSYNRSKPLLNQYCWMACVYADRETAGALFKRIGDDFDMETTWKDQQTPRAWRRWANGLADPPLEPKDLETWKSGGRTSPLGHTVLWMLAVGLGGVLLVFVLIGGASILLMLRSSTAGMTPPLLPK